LLDGTASAKPRGQWAGRTACATDETDDEIRPQSPRRRQDLATDGEGIDSYWRQLNTKLFVVFHELQVAARTDDGLRRIMLPAIAKFDERWLEMVENVFPDLSQSKNFVLGNFLTLFLLEGMAGNYLRNPGRWTQALLDDLKQRLANELFADVTGVDRSAKPPPLQRVVIETDLNACGVAASRHSDIRR
jgi:hypothetical protein